MTLTRRVLFTTALCAPVVLPVVRKAKAQLAEFRSVPTVEDFLALLDPGDEGQGLIANRSDIEWREIVETPFLPGTAAQRGRPQPGAVTPPPSPLPVRPREPRRMRPTAIAMPDVFEVNSAALPLRTVAMLDNLAMALSRVPASRALITGHTDISGSAAGNDALSQRRAEAARRHVVERRGIEGVRVRALGVGARDLIQGLPPTAPNNRRIQVWGQPGS